jgi:hypothetical protein
MYPLGKIPFEKCRLAQVWQLYIYKKVTVFLININPMNNFVQNNLRKSLFLGIVLLTSPVFAQEAKMSFASTMSDFQSGIARI